MEKRDKEKTSAEFSQKRRYLRLACCNRSGEPDNQRPIAPRHRHGVATRFASESVALTSSHCA